MLAKIFPFFQTLAGLYVYFTLALQTLEQAFENNPCIIGDQQELSLFIISFEVSPIPAFLQPTNLEKALTRKTLLPFRLIAFSFNF